MLKSKLLESRILVTQAMNNSKEQFANSPNFNEEIVNAIMDALGAHTTMSKQALDSENLRQELKDVLLGPAQLYETSPPISSEGPLLDVDWMLAVEEPGHGCDFLHAEMRWKAHFCPGYFDSLHSRHTGESRYPEGGRCTGNQRRISPKPQHPIMDAGSSPA